MVFLLKQEMRWYRAIIFAVIFMAIPSILESSWTAYQRYYYQNAPIETFYKAITMEVGNVCVGDKIQQVDAVRFVYETETGWAAEIIRELYNVNTDKRKKVYDEAASIFIDKIEDGKTARDAAIPLLKEGIYQWDITYVKLYLPYGVIRVDVPTLRSNSFSVINCNQ